MNHESYGQNGQVVSESDSQSVVAGSIPIKVKLVMKNEESRQRSVIPCKGKRNHEVWSHREEGLGSHCLD